MNKAPYNIGELIALAIVSIFCLGLSWMIAVGTSNMADHLRDQRQSSTHSKGVQFKVIGPEIGA